MTLNAAMVTRTLHFICMSNRGAHMLTGLQQEDGPPRSFHIAKLGNNWQTANFLLP